MDIYVVQQGDSLSSIANRYGVSVERIRSDNGLISNRLVIGQALLILRPSQIHIVRQGETLISIANDYDTTPLALIQNNPTLINFPNIFAGEVIAITLNTERTREIRVNGYAYPEVNLSAMKQALPYLTTLTIFGYGFTESGELIEINDTPIIQLAKQFRVAPVMLLSSITEGGNFSTDRASVLFNNTQLQNVLIEKILAQMALKGYYGLDVDFEFIDPADKEPYQQFLRNITTRLNESGYFVNVDLAPKTSVDQPGLLYEAHDYAAIGQIADTVLIMTYEWGYSFGPPLAVSPLRSVEQVLNFAVSQIPREKILMGVSNYGYDWTLPFIKGESRAETIGNEQAVRIAAAYGSNIEYDEKAQAPFFTYFDRMRREHIVWFEDVRSINARLDLIDNLQILGAGYWNIMRTFAQNWGLINSRFSISKII